MDPRFNGLSDSVNNIEFEDGSFYPVYSDPQSSWDNELDSQFSIPDLDPFSLNPSPSFSSEIDSPDDNLSNPVFKYLNQILLEENMEDRPSMFHDSLALRATEKSLYDALGKNYPSSPYSDNPDSLFRNSSENSVDSLSVVDSGLLYNDLIPNVYNDNESILQFRKGIEEASKFLVSSNLNTYSNPSIKKLDYQEVKVDCLDVSRGTKHLHWDEEVEDQRSSKQSAILVEEEVEISELLDQIFLCNDPNMVLNRSNTDNNQVISARNRSRRKTDKSEAIDLNTLLISCAQSVAANDRRTANELLKKIRENSSTSGDACQRVAHVFANGLEARFTGLYEPVKSKKYLAAEMLKAYQVYLSASPFKLIPIFFANKMVAELGSKSEAIHIVDFGIRYGFQWPMLIKHLSTFPGGPPRLRITGIEYPQPGFRPAEQVEQTGHRLAKYCERFHVPFEYHAIAKQNWEEIKVQDLNLKKSEVLVVNSLFRFNNLPDETAVEDNSPRDSVLKLIRSMNPDLFVNSVTNGSYSSPFFVTRFREALYHYSALFDMFDSTVPREDEQRLKFEQEFYGREVLNVVSCEGSDRVERPEVYKQWQIRHIRAGLKALPLNKEIMNKLSGKVKKGYHKDFVFDEDGCWMLQGWKGRIICASSCWVSS